MFRPFSALAARRRDERDAAPREPRRPALALAPPPGPAALPPSTSRRVYLRLLTWTFTFFNSVRVLSYVPTIWALVRSGDSSQHSLWTWGTWFCANVTMALWLMERHDTRFDRAALVNVANAAMCLAVIVVIAVERF